MNRAAIILGPNIRESLTSSFSITFIDNSKFFDELFDIFSLKISSVVILLKA